MFEQLNATHLVILMSLVAALLVYAAFSLGRITAKWQVRKIVEESELLCFVDLAKISIIHRNGKWAAVDNQGEVFAGPSEDIRAVLRSAAGEVSHIEGLS